MNLARRCGTVNAPSVALDNKIKSKVMAGLEHCEELMPIKIMAAIIHPLFQKKQRMVMSGLCTDEQYEAGWEELLDRLSGYYERSENAPQPRKKAGNKWDQFNDGGDLQTSARRKAEEELKRYKGWSAGNFLPDMAPTKVLGGIDNFGQPNEPVYAFGKVTNRGDNLQSGRNHADYIDGSGYYNLPISSLAIIGANSHLLKPWETGN